MPAARFARLGLALGACAWAGAPRAASAQGGRPLGEAGVRSTDGR